MMTEQDLLSQVGHTMRRTSDGEYTVFDPSGHPVITGSLETVRAWLENEFWSIREIAALKELTDWVQGLDVSVDIPAIQEEVRARLQHVALQKEIDRMRAVDNIVFGK